MTVRRAEINREKNPRQGYWVTQHCVRFFSSQDESHTFSLDATSSVVLVVPESIASIADIWYLNGRRRRRYLTWDSEWMMSMANGKELFGLSMVGVSGLNHQISEHNFLLHTNSFQSVRCTLYVCPWVHINSNGLRTNSLELEKRIIFGRFVFASAEERKKCGCSNGSIAFHRIHSTIIWL